MFNSIIRLSDSYCCILSCASLEKEISIENENILLISCKILYSSQEEDFPILIWYVICMKIQLITYITYLITLLRLIGFYIISSEKANAYLLLIIIRVE